MSFDLKCVVSLWKRLYLDSCCVVCTNIMSEIEPPAAVSYDSEGVPYGFDTHILVAT